LRSQRKSKKKEIIAFVIAVLTAVFAALDLHGWHMYLMLGVTAAIAILSAVLMARKLTRSSAAESETVVTPKPHGN
jgi:membrane protein implicated in regulation of membrane protease activity